MGIESWPLWIVAIAGGVSAEVYQRYQEREKRPPSYIRTLNFWLSTAGMILAAGFLVALYDASQLIKTQLAAFHVGLSGPLLIGKGTRVTKMPQID